MQGHFERKGSTSRSQSLRFDCRGVSEYRQFDVRTILHQPKQSLQRDVSVQALYSSKLKVTIHLLAEPVTKHWCIHNTPNTIIVKYQPTGTLNPQCATAKPHLLYIVQASSGGREGLEKPFLTNMNQK